MKMPILKIFADRSMTTEIVTNKIYILKIICQAGGCPANSHETSQQGK
jgi:hypothetical protein